MRRRSRSNTAMNNLRLSGGALPSAVWQDGKAWRIRPGARGVLKILRMLADTELAPWHKTALLCEWFYVDGVPPEPLEPFRRFLRMGEADEDVPEDDAPPDFDYEFDAPEIYASFMQLYRIDLLENDLHWWKFRALLGGCFAAECALSAKLHLRRMNPDKADTQTRRAIERVQLPTPESEEEKRMSALISERLRQGLPIDDLLKREE